MFFHRLSRHSPRGGRNLHRCLAAIAVSALACLSAPFQAGKAGAQNPAIWSVPDVDALPYTTNGLQIRRGRDLITATYAHIGPDVAERAKRYAGNNLACANCHLQAGTKKFGLPIFGLAQDYPAYSARSGVEITIESRINACMTRSMNGRPLPNASPEMRALVAYINFLSTGVRKSEHLTGLGSGTMPELDRPADPVRGKPIYEKFCEGCHNVNGAGVRRSMPGVDLGYAFPPLWGSDSFNDGAGMARLITAANFVHANMPNGVDYLYPRLSAQEAWDVAAYMVSQPRPHKAGAARDYPDLLLKPVDTPYGPYADGFSEEQHKYGPFAPIRDRLNPLRRDSFEVRNPNREP
jgi:thiosulfate dehydrogenase